MIFGQKSNGRNAFACGTRLSRTAITLAEAIIASALAVVLGFLMLQFISSTFGAHRKGTLSRSAQSGTRALLAIFVSELRSASVPPLPSPSATSPVFWPGVWGREAEGGPAAESFYPRLEVSDSGAGLPRDTATNRLFYVRSAQLGDPTGASLDPLQGYALVELLVPQDRPGVLERRLHPMAGVTNLGFSVKNVKGADGLQRPAWVLDLDALSGADEPASPDILYDAGTDAQIGFRVSHLQFAPPSDPGRTRNPEIFDPAVFRIEVVVALDAQKPEHPLQAWPEKAHWDTHRTEETEVKIPSVRGRT